MRIKITAEFKITFKQFINLMSIVNPKGPTMFSYVLGISAHQQRQSPFVFQICSYTTNADINDARESTSLFITGWRLHTAGRHFQ